MNLKRLTLLEQELGQLTKQMNEATSLIYSLRIRLGMEGAPYDHPVAMRICMVPVPQITQNELSIEQVIFKTAELVGTAEFKIQMLMKQIDKLEEGR